MSNIQLNNKIRAKGFTIVELLIVVVVIAILATITVVAYNGIRDRANDSAARAALVNATKKLEAYRYDPSNSAQDYPSSLFVAGVPISSGSTLNYNYYSAGNYYCLESRNGSAVYHQTSIKMTQVNTPCPPTSGLIGWWPLNGDAKNYSTGDSSAIITNATPVAGQNGIVNGSYSFTGNTPSNINTNHISSRNVFSFSIWVYPLTSTGYRTPLSETRDCCQSGLRGIDFKTSYSVANATSLGIWAGGNGYAASASGISSTVDTWNFFVGTYNGSIISLYKDGVLVASTTYTGTPGSASAPYYLFIGSNPNGGGAFKGSVDDVRVYDRALSAEEVSTLYSVGAE